MRSEKREVWSGKQVVSSGEQKRGAKRGANAGSKGGEQNRGANNGD